MGIWHWLADNDWPNLLNTFFTGGGVWFAGYAIHEDAKARRVSNVFTATNHHWEVWSDFYHHPEYWRVKQSTVDLAKNPITFQEEGFVKFVILHMNAVFQASRLGMIIKPEAFRRDVYSFLSFPIPSAVWENLKVLQNDDFAEFVEQCRNWK